MPTVTCANQRHQNRQTVDWIDNLSIKQKIDQNNRLIETHQSPFTSLTFNNMHMEIKLTNQVNHQRHKYHPLTIHTVFTQISAATLIKFFAPQMRRLFEGGVYLFNLICRVQLFKIGRDKDIFSFNLTVYYLAVRKFCTSNWKKEERSWAACCAGKVRGLHNRTTY